MMMVEVDNDVEKATLDIIAGLEGIFDIRLLRF